MSQRHGRPDSLAFFCTETRSSSPERSEGDLWNSFTVRQRFLSVNRRALSIRPFPRGGRTKPEKIVWSAASIMSEKSFRESPCHDQRTTQHVPAAIAPRRRRSSGQRAERRA